MPSPAGAGAGIVERNLDSIPTSPIGTLHRLVARAVGASKNQPTNNWAKSPGAIAGFTIVFSIVAVACIYLLWRGPNRKAFPCIKRNKDKALVDAEDASDEYIQDSRGPANWRNTIVRKEAFFPVRKARSTDMLNEKDSGYELQPRTESMYSYDSKYTTMTGRSRRTSRASYNDQGQRLSRVSNHEMNRVSAGFPRRPPSVGNDLAAPQSVYSVYSTSNGFLGTPTEMFGLPTQSPNAYSPRSPRSPTSGQQTDYFGPGATASSSNNGLLGVSSPQAAASRNSLVRKSVGVPSPLSQSASTPDGESAPAKRAGRRKSRTVSFVDDNDAVSVISNVSRHSRSGSSPPRGSRNSQQFSPGAQQPQPVPPVPSMFAQAITSGYDETGASSIPSPPWTGVGATSPPPLSPPASRLPVGAAESIYQLPDGAYPPNHPVALAHQKLSSAANSPPLPPAATMASQGFPSPLPAFAAAPASPPAVRSPTTPGSPGRIPSAPGYHSRLSSRSSSLAAATAMTPPSNGGYTKTRFGSASPETSTAPTSREGSSSPPSSQNHFSTPPSSVPSHGSAPNSRVTAKGHRKNNSSGHSNSTILGGGGGGGSLDGHSASSHRSHKRGLWFDSIDETGTFDMQPKTKV